MMKLFKTFLILLIIPGLIGWTPVKSSDNSTQMGVINNNFGDIGNFMKRYQRALYVDSNGHVALSTTKRLYFDGGNDTYILEPSDGYLKFYTNGALGLTIDVNQSVYLEPTKSLYFDGGNDTRILESSANVLDIYTAGVKRISQNGINTIIGAGGTGTLTPALKLDGGSDTGGGGYIAFNRNSINKNMIGSESAIMGSASNNLILYATTALGIDIYAGAASVLTITSSAFDPVGTGAVNSGTATNYWGDISYKTLTDRGCIGSFDTGVELQDGTKVTATEAILTLKPSLSKSTVYGVPMMDYKSFPKNVYKKAMIDNKPMLRDKDDEPYFYEVKQGSATITVYTEEDAAKYSNPVKKLAADGVEMTAMQSIMLQAIKELTLRVKALEAK